MFSTLKSQKGQGLVEYGLILGLIAIVVIVILASVGTQVKLVFTSIDTSLKSI